MYSNVRGLSSKLISLESISKTIKSNVIMVGETFMKGSSKADVPGYTVYNKNRTFSGGGGIATYVREDERNTTLKVKEGTNENEFLITRHDQFVKPINVINFYGKLECRNKKEVIESEWANIVEEINEIERRNEEWVLMSDLNMLLGTYIVDNKKLS